VIAPSEDIGPDSRSLLITLLLIIAGIVILRTAWVCDDAYISFRTVDNFVNGYGLTWNTDERVQGFTNPLWVFLMAAFRMITGELYYTSILVSLALTLGALLLASLKVSRSASGCVLILVTAIFSKAFIDYATSGLENPLSYLLLAAFYFLYLHRRRDRNTFFAMTLLTALAGLNRLDTVILYLPALVVAFWELRGRKLFLPILLGSSPLILWECFSIVYYGFPFPNTYYAKLHSGIPLHERIHQGFVYFLETLNVDPLTLLIIIAGFAVVLISRNRKALPLSVGVFLYLVYIVGIGGDFMSGRFFAVPLLASLMLISQWRRAETWVTRLAPLAVVMIIGFASPRAPLLSDKSYGTHGEGGINEKGIADERAWYYQSTGLLRASREKPMPAHPWSDDGRHIQLKGDSFRSVSCVGFAGYFAGPNVHIYDGYALTEPLLARLPTTDLRNWRVGHYGRVPPWKYLKGLEEGTNTIEDSSLSAFYDSLCLITRGDLFDWNRWVAIWKMNTGGYDYLVQAYTQKPRLEVDYADICSTKGRC
jgi:arabinofuranosyltransferase